MLPRGGSSLDQILVRDLSRIHKQVHFKLCERIRSKEETVDIAKDSVVDYLQYGGSWGRTDTVGWCVGVACLQRSVFVMSGKRAAAGKAAAAAKTRIMRWGRSILSPQSASYSTTRITALVVLKSDG